ncbi:MULTISPECIES: hypothetical protein [Oscillatoriales]|uniref:hypothetical protein n=1 Tax=Oscillatoriales TaxID=1150 RepID=UPI00030959D5
MLRPGKIIVDPRQQDNRKLSTATDARMFYHGYHILAILSTPFRKKMSDRH